MRKQIIVLFLTIISLLTNSLYASISANNNKIVVNANTIDLETKYQVTEIIDGDTIKVDISGVIETVRLLQIDTPESNHPDKSRNVSMGKNAKEFTSALLKDKKVRIEFDKERRDKYDRLLCYVYVNNKDGKEICVNEELIKTGMAKVVKYEPNVLKYDDYKKLEKPVRESKKGIWENIEANYPKKQKLQKSKTNNINISVNKGLIKGNKRSKIYHCPDQRDYNKIKEKNIVYFETEDEAKQAGYRKAKR